MEEVTEQGIKSFNLWVTRYDGYDQLQVSDDDRELLSQFKAFLEDYFMGKMEIPKEERDDETLEQLKRNYISKNKGYRGLS